MVPLLATEVPTVDNGGVRLRGDGGMDVTWKLRPDVTWHDGQPFTSADVKFTVDAINGPNYNPESTDGFDRITSVDTPDPLTAVVHYKEIYAPYDIQFIRGALPKHVLEGRDIDRAQDYNRNPLGTGPYHVVEWKAGEHILLERVPHYWRGDRVSEDPATALQVRRQHQHSHQSAEERRGPRGRAGAVGQVPRAPRDPIDRHRTDSRQCLRARDAERKAISGVCRRSGQARAHRRARSRAVRAHDPRRPGPGGARADSAGLVGLLRSRGEHPFDPALARDLLDQAGWKAGADGIREKGGARLAFTLITQAGYAIRENIAQAIERQLRDVGVDVKVELQDGTAISAIWFEGRFEAMLHWWQMPSDPELTTFFAADRTPPAGRNINYFQNEELTKLLYASDRTVDRSERKALLARAQAIVADQVPEIPLYTVTRLDAVPATLQHFKGNPTNTGIFWNVHEWEIK